LIAYAPVKSDSGEFLGLLAIASGFDTLNNIVAQTKIGKTGYAFLIDDDGMVIAHPDEKLILEANINKIPGMEKIAKAVMARQKGIEYYTFQGVEKLASFAPAGVKSWSVVTTQSKDEIMDLPRDLRNRSILVGSILLCISLVLVYFFGRSVSMPISRVVEGLANSASQVASASVELSSASNHLAEGASEQAASIEETSSSLEEMSSMTKQNAENANQANKLMAETRETVSRASSTMDMLTTSMVEISKASEETSKIIKTIDEIAFQTNLLALNAAVEAARAGEAGAGFAVVADEVRNLAMRAAEAADNTANLIEGTVKRVKEGSELVEKTGKEFQAVAATVGKSSELVGEISAASLEQSQGIEQVNKAVSAMDSVVQQNASSAEQSASAAEEMNAQAENMKTFVGELVTIVDGSTTTGVTKKSKKEGTTQAVPATKTRKPALVGSRTSVRQTLEPRKGNGTSKTLQSNAESLFPLGNEESMSDF
jgi:methyl-accepting chemotaxis protein